MDARPARRPAGAVGGRVVGDLHDPALGPGAGQQSKMASHPLVRRAACQYVDRPLKVSGHDRRQDLGQLLESGTHVRVVAVGKLRGEARREEESDGLVERQAQRRQEGALDDPPSPGLAPQRNADLALEGPQVSIHGPTRHGYKASDRIDGRALGMSRQVTKNPVEAREPIVLRGVERVYRVGHRGSIRPGAARSRRGPLDLSRSFGPRPWPSDPGAGCPPGCR